MVSQKKAKTTGDKRRKASWQDRCKIKYLTPILFYARYLNIS